MLFFVIYIISSFFQVYEFYFLFHCFFDKRRVSGKVEFLAYVFQFFTTTFIFLIFGIPILTAITSLSSFLIVSLVYTGTMKKRILSAVFSFVIMTLTECVVAVIVGMVGVDMFASQENYSLYGTIGLPIVQTLIAHLIRNFKNLKEGEEIPISYWLISIALPAFSLYLFLVLDSQPNISHFNMIGCTCVLFALNIFVFYLYDRQLAIFQVQREKENLKLQNQYQENQLDLMHQAGEQVREFRHDMKKHFSLIELYVKKGEKEKLSEYLGEIKENVTLQQEYVQTGNFTIDSILNFKIQEALHRGIHIEVELKIPSNLELSMYDMNVLLSNLLDNSIEAVEDLSEKNITFLMQYRLRSLFISICNPYKLLEKNSDNEVQTTKSDKENHGIGLSNVKKVVNKYEGRMDINDKNYIFEVQIMLFL